MYRSYYTNSICNLLTIDSNNAFNVISTAKFNPCHVNNKVYSNSLSKPNNKLEIDVDQIYKFEINGEPRVDQNLQPYCLCRNNWNGTDVGDGCKYCDYTIANGVQTPKTDADSGTHTYINSYGTDYPDYAPNPDGTYGYLAGPDCQYSSSTNCGNNGKVAGDGKCMCNPGYQPTDDGKACVQCPTGTYNDTAGGKCTGCSDGKQPNLGRTGCINCPNGQYKDPATNSCRPCQGNWTSSDGFRCDKCADGWMGKNCTINIATACQTGTYNGDIRQDSYGNDVYTCTCGVKDKYGRIKYGGTHCDTLCNYQYYRIDDNSDSGDRIMIRSNVSGCSPPEIYGGRCVSSGNGSGNYTATKDNNGSCPVNPNVGFGADKLN